MKVERIIMNVKLNDNMDVNMDVECIKLCEAINAIPGLQTSNSCCGHGKEVFSIFFHVYSMNKFPILLYYLDPCHVGFRWNCTAHTDCGMSPVYFRIQSIEKGQKAYSQANKIAYLIQEHLKLASEECPEHGVSYSSIWSANDKLPSMFDES